MIRKRRGRPAGTAGRELLGIARDVFTSAGFRRATMDEIAARAGVSKQSLYAAYPSKDALYAAVVRDWVDQGRDALAPHTRRLAGCTDLRGELARFVRVLQAGILSPPVMQLRALVAAEAAAFPDVAADYVERSWQYNMAQLAQTLRALQDRGMLRLDDAEIAAEQLVWLAVAAPMNEISLRGTGHGYDPGRLERVAAQAVSTFLSRYGQSASAAP